jgi:hypothetical protein
MMTLDWQVLIVAFAAVSLQIMISIKLMFGRSAVKLDNPATSSDFDFHERVNQVLADDGYSPDEENGDLFIRPGVMRG